jgi:hypothetical protein
MDSSKANLAGGRKREKELQLEDADTSDFPTRATSDEGVNDGWEDGGRKEGV